MKEKGSYKFEVGDIVDFKDGLTVSPPGFSDKAYMKDLVVVFRFWDGNNVYVLNTQDNDICVIALEDDMINTGTRFGYINGEPKNEEEPKEQSSHYLGYVYRVNKRLVAAETIEEAIETFYSHPCHKCNTIEEVKLLDRDLALIQTQKKK